jgi:hypothetical protein
MTKDLKRLEPEVADLARRFGDIVPELGRALAPEVRQSFRLFGESYRKVEDALTIAGENAAALFTTRLRELCLAISEGRIAANEATLAVAKECARALASWLTGVAIGRHPGVRPLARSFIPLNKCLRRPADLRELFFPDLSICPPAPSQRRVLSKTLIGDFYVHQANRYRCALSKLLGKPDEGIRPLIRCLSTLEQVQIDSVQRIYWWIGKAIVGAAASGDLPFSPLLADVLGRLGERLDQSSNGPLAEDPELLRDGLFLVAQSAPGSKEITEIQGHYGLDNGFSLVGTDAEALSEDEKDRALLDAITAVESAKAAWLDFGRRNPGWHAKFNKSLCRLKLGTLGDANFKNLVQWLLDCALDFYVSEREYDDELDLEISSALLILENAVTRNEPKGSLGGLHVDRLRQRLERAVTRCAAGVPAHE